MSILSSEWSNPQTFAINTDLGGSTDAIQEMTIQNLVKLYGSDEVAYNQFSDAVAISPDGNTIVVGATQNVEAGIKSGAAYIFQKFGATWVEAQKLVKAAPKRKANEAFGYAIDMDDLGDRIVISSPSCEPVGGMVSVFKMGNTGLWEEEATFQASDTFANLGFGTAVSIDATGTRIAVAAVNGVNAQDVVTGAVYIFVRTGTTWAQEARLAPTLAANHIGATSISLSGDGLRCMVGNTGLDNGNQGTAYVFARQGSTWYQEARIVPDTAGINFGISIASDTLGTRIVIGANASENTQNGLVTTEGKAYVYIRSTTTWAKEAELIPVDVRAINKAGSSVSITGDGDKVIVGAPETFHSLTSLEFQAMGSAYAFTRKGLDWSQAFVLQRKDHDITENRNQFGGRTAVSGLGNIAVISARSDNVKGNQSGSVYVFQLNVVAESAILSDNYLVSNSFDACPNAFTLGITDDGGNLIIGSPTELGVDVNSGTMSFYTNLSDVWSVHSKVVGINSEIINGHREVGSLFGGAIAISGNGLSVAILAPGDHLATAAITGENPSGNVNGAIYMYRKTGNDWVFQKLLFESINYQLAGQMAFSDDGNTFAFSMMSATVGMDAICSVYVFEGNVWLKKQDLSPAAGKPGSESRSLAMSGDGTVIAVGFTASAKVHTFVNNGTLWAEAAIVTAVECPSTNHGFGRALALSYNGEVLAVGAPRTSLLPGDTDEGLVFVFKKVNSTWVRTAMVSGSLHHPGNGFGESIAISNSGTRMIVGSPYEDQSKDGTNIIDCGVAYYLEATDTEWNEIAILRRRVEVATAKYGDNVAMAGNGLYALVVSSRFGSVSVFKLKA